MGKGKRETKIVGSKLRHHKAVRPLKKKQATLKKDEEFVLIYVLLWRERQSRAIVALV